MIASDGFLWDLAYGHGLNGVFFLGGGDLGEKDWEGRRGARDSGNISREGGGWLWFSTPLTDLHIKLLVLPKKSYQPWPLQPLKTAIAGRC